MGFTLLQWIIIGLSGLGGVISIWLFLDGKFRYALWCLIASGFLLRLMMTWIDPFLNLWDEQFHALVAKNMSAHPLHPQLYTNPVIPYDYTDWARNHFWIHKQPFFLWVIAAFFKIFGATEWALRLPAALLSTAMIPMIFRIGKLIVNEKTGWMAAFLFCFSSFFVNIVSGNIHTDQNDNFFMAIVTASIWALFEYFESGKAKWIWIIGILAGLAVLTKWLTGLLVFSGWGLYLLSDPEQRKNFRAWKPMLLALGLAAIIVLPWQIHILRTFPNEAAFEYKLNTLHFTIAVEGHEGPSSYYFDLFGDHYGWLSSWLIIPALITLALAAPDRRKALVFVSMGALLYLFFTLAKTKMPLFCLPVASIVFVVLGSLLVQPLRLAENLASRNLKTLFTLLLIVTGIKILHPGGDLQKQHSTIEHDYTYWPYRQSNRISFTKIADQISDKKTIVFNCAGLDCISFMFYTGITAYGDYPSEKDYEDLKKRNLAMAVIADDQLPDWIMKYPDIKIIREKLYRF